ncbi:MAG: SsrA-binding protein SmpB [Candidatus Yonathbacteria bacterium]|nr:SsrA-binding protein SmpB [Candidatus Yonathbacteria bacterium]NTW47492.1 SsrA-binding protein SmpB [Candidatus Yonathbacteria bacterium]
MSLIRNKKAHFDYDILEKFEAGLDLHGFEVKSLRGGRGSLEGAHVLVRGGEAYIVGMTIPPYQSVNTPLSYDPARTRRLLLSKKEIAQLSDAESTNGLTVIPLSVYNKHKFLKVEVAIGRGKKQFDKRETIKKREAEREMRRSLKDE